MASKLVELINGWIVERGSAVVQEKHIAFLRDQIVALENQVAALQEENAQLKHKAESETEKNLTNSAANEFVEHRGLLFKRKPEGGYHLAAYCPSCRISLASGRPHFPLQCSKCKFMSDVRGNAIQIVISELPR
jgi:hypothetical protein